jgi:beta-galactosidase
VTTSYDFEAPISECGDMIWKYTLFRDVAKKHFGEVPALSAHNLTKKSFGPVKLTQGLSLVEALPVVGERTVKSEHPPTFQSLEQPFGYVLYEAAGDGHCEAHIQGRGILLKSGKIIDVKVSQRGVAQSSEAPLSGLAAGKVSILVESLGWPGSGRLIYSVGVVNASIDGKSVSGWTATTLPLAEFKFKNVPWKSELPEHAPAFYRGLFTVDSPADTFLNTKGLGRGVAFINGVHVGTYWTIGPQMTLYIRAPQLKVGENELVIFESGDLGEVPTLTLEAAPIFRV